MSLLFCKYFRNKSAGQILYGKCHLDSSHLISTIGWCLRCLDWILISKYRSDVWKLESYSYGSRRHLEGVWKVFRVSWRWLEVVQGVWKLFWILWHTHMSENLLIFRHFIHRLNTLSARRGVIVFTNKGGPEIFKEFVVGLKDSKIRILFSIHPTKSQNPEGGKFLSSGWKL